ncbi:MAG: WYL domain-containing protein [Deltaproteobacteria bacterium]|nr:WYL domain-containing protein [Deltaproteobacteria bacterium]
MGILAALLEARTVCQSDLAAQLGVSSETVRKHMLELQVGGVPLTRDHDEGEQRVYWSVPSSWGPKGVNLEKEDVEDVLRVLVACPRSKRRDRLLDKLLDAMPQRDLWRQRLRVTRVAEPSTSDHDDAIDRLAEAASTRQALTVEYFSRTRGMKETRTMSPQLMVPPVQFFAVCHNTLKLRRYRIDHVRVLAPSTEAYVAADPAEIEAMLREGLEGYTGDEPLVEHRFRVRGEPARWFAESAWLKDAKRKVIDASEVEYSYKVRAVGVLARRVVGLGAAATALTPALREEVVRLARGSLEAHGEAASSRTDVQSPLIGSPVGGEGQVDATRAAATVAASASGPDSKEQP